MIRALAVLCATVALPACGSPAALQAVGDPSSAPCDLRRARDVLNMSPDQEIRKDQEAWLCEKAAPMLADLDRKASNPGGSGGTILPTPERTPFISTKGSSRTSMHKR
jgi:hypothetical protein